LWTVGVDYLFVAKLAQSFDLNTSRISARVLRRRSL